jgi:hypothetical protein
MIHGKAPPSPLPPITVQLVAALARLRKARRDSNPDQEWVCQAALDLLLDRYLQGQR